MHRLLSNCTISKFSGSPYVHLNANHISAFYYKTLVYILQYSRHSYIPLVHFYFVASRIEFLNHIDFFSGLMSFFIHICLGVNTCYFCPPFVSFSLIKNPNFLLYYFSFVNLYSQALSSSGCHANISSVGNA